jgi:2-C-methyl-D-erythritol 4-phosphate cytidylyltransferase/2-C-methyl-D-erythritol 2,4-cyclodiphosphate synthase
MGAPCAARGICYRVQTPQAFRFEPVLAAHRAWSERREATDDDADGGAGLWPSTSTHHSDGDAMLAQAHLCGSDFAAGPALPATRLPRTGMGFDVHRLVDGKPSCGCAASRSRISQGLSGHSDADVAIHALVDAILGALGARAISASTSRPSDPQWKGASSRPFP